MTANYPNVDLVSINSYIKLGQNLSISSQDIERKQNFGVICESSQDIERKQSFGVSYAKILFPFNILRTFTILYMHSY